jgi:two-component system response regulator GlrR
MARPDADAIETHDQARVAFNLSTRRARLHLVWSDGGGPHDVELGERDVVGSSAQASVRVDDRAVSRIHASLELRADGLWVHDLGSRNGTWVEGVRLGTACIVEGSRLRVGETTLTVVSDPSSTRSVPLWPTNRFGALLGASECMRELFLCLSRYAASDAPVLLHGETGTGKELAALALHEASPRGAGPFVVVDCGALPETLLESELFGHTRGAFTGAIATRVGAFESADRGTVFLDEIGELPLPMQPKLLRALESQTVRRLGETEHRRVDVRFVAATHRDLQAMVGAGAFREDLYFRLGVLQARIPPLRERVEDLPLLLEHFLRDTPEARVGAEIVSELGDHRWLGNVRELRSFARRILPMGAPAAWAATRGLDWAGRSIAPRPSSPVAPAPSQTHGLPAVSTEAPFKVLREQWVDHLEREYIGALVRRGLNAPAIAESAGLDRSYVLRLMRKHGL